MTKRWPQIFVFAVAAILLLLVSLAGGLASGFFLLPVALIGLLAWAFYAAVRNVHVRNDLGNRSSGWTARYADGKPFDRSLHDKEGLDSTLEDEAVFRMHREEELRRQGAEAEWRRTRNDPSDYKGPPPNVPFP